MKSKTKNTERQGNNKKKKRNPSCLLQKKDQSHRNQGGDHDLGHGKALFFE